MRIVGKRVRKMVRTVKSAGLLRESEGALAHFLTKRCSIRMFSEHGGYGGA